MPLLYRNKALGSGYICGRTSFSKALGGSFLQLYLTHRSNSKHPQLLTNLHFQMDSTVIQAESNVAAGTSDGEQAGKVARRRSGPRSRSSPFKGVTQYRRTGKWEAHIWIPNPRGRGYQRHLGSYHTAEDAARCFDRATIRVRGPNEELNFPVEEYANDQFMVVRTA